MNVFHLMDTLWRSPNLIARILNAGFTLSNRHNFRLLINFLLRPTPLLQNAIDNFMSTTGWNDRMTAVIGVQIRTGTGVKEAERTSPGQVEQFWKCAEKISKRIRQRNNLSNTTVKWFTTTDSDLVSILMFITVFPLFIIVISIMFVVVALLLLLFLLMRFL